MSPVKYYKMKEIIPAEIIEQRIFFIRKKRVMIDRDLAELYETETKNLNRQVKRNIGRFPSEFMFQLNEEEKNELVTNCHRFETLKHSTSMPFAFTENGVAMLATVLKSDRSIKMSIFIIKTFVKLREYLSSHKELERKIELLESKYDNQFQIVFEAIKQLIHKGNEPRKPVGYKIKKK